MDLMYADVGKLCLFFPVHHNDSSPTALGVHHGDAYAPFHAPDQRVQQEDGKPPAHAFPVLCALQLCTDAQDAENDASNGRWCIRHVARHGLDC